MTVTFPPTEPSTDDIETLRQVFQLWNGGNQPQAVELLRPLADQSHGWAVPFMAWLLMQQGYPAVDESVTYALKASANGMPWQAVQTFNHLLGQLPNAPQLIDRVPQLMQAAAPWHGGFDPVGQGWNLASQGNFALAIRMMGMTSSVPIAPSDWEPIIASARQRVSELDDLVASARDERERVRARAAEVLAAIEKEKDDLATSAKQANLLVSSTVSDATNALFDAEAVRNTDESKSAWGWGLAVLGAAAVVAVLPLVLHYVGNGPTYSTTALIGAHVASTAALATFAGVLLARARTRDHAAQRARDLSTAMGTMIAYSNRISDAAEKERFMMTMGQLVLQAHLTAGTGHSKDDSLTGLVALMNLIRPNSPATD